MPAIERVIPLVGHLPLSLREALARRLRELTGLGLIALSGAITAALMTWSVQDPSLSHATSRAIRNVLGYPGAIGADLLMQILGLGAIMLLLPVAVWGWRMLTHRPFDREALRLGCWILCTVIAAGFASCWPHNTAWPLPTGLGGVVGDALLRAPAVVFGPPGFIYRVVLGLILFVAMAACFLFACGWGAKEQDDELTPISDDDEPFVEEDDNDRSSVSLGWLFHAAMSAKARLGWLFTTAYKSLVSSGSQGRSAAFERQEPNIGGGRAAPSIAPAHDDHDEDEDEDEAGAEDGEVSARADVHELGEERGDECGEESTNGLVPAGHATSSLQDSLRLSGPSTQCRTGACGVPVGDSAPSAPKMTAPTLRVPLGARRLDASSCIQTLSGWREYWRV